MTAAAQLSETKNTCCQDSQVLYNLVQIAVLPPVHFLEYGSSRSWCFDQVPSQQLSSQSEILTTMTLITTWRQ